MTAHLELIYTSNIEQLSKLGLARFTDKWHQKYPQTSKSRNSNWDDLVTIFSYPADIRKVIYTANAIESLNSVIRKFVKTRKVFPNPDAAINLIYLAVESA